MTSGLCSSSVKGGIQADGWKYPPQLISFTGPSRPSTRCSSLFIARGMSPLLFLPLPTPLQVSFTQRGAPSSFSPWFKAFILQETSLTTDPGTAPPPKETWCMEAHGLRSRLGLLVPPSRPLKPTVLSAGWEHHRPTASGPLPCRQEAALECCHLQGSDDRDDCCLSTAAPQCWAHSRCSVT